MIIYSFNLFYGEVLLITNLITKSTFIAFIIENENKFNEINHVYSNYLF